MDTPTPENIPAPAAYVPFYKGSFAHTNNRDCYTLLVRGVRVSEDKSQEFVTYSNGCTFRFYRKEDNSVASSLVGHIDQQHRWDAGDKEKFATTHPVHVKNPSA